MQKYGTIFEPNFNVKKDQFRNLIIEYYGNPNLQKVKNTQTQSIYMAMLNSNLLANKQYIVTTCQKDNNKIGIIKSLSNLYWNSFQTRTIDNVNVITFDHIPVKNNKFNIILKIIERNEKFTKYIMNEYPVYITLIHDNVNLYEYPNTGNLIAALDTFKSIITFK